MFKIFGFDAGDYLITDESSLHDFKGVDDMEMPTCTRKFVTFMPWMCPISSLETCLKSSSEFTSSKPTRNEEFCRSRVRRRHFRRPLSQHPQPGGVGQRLTLVQKPG
jgi:hypothetical protein